MLKEGDTKNILNVLLTTKLILKSMEYFIAINVNMMYVKDVG